MTLVREGATICPYPINEKGTYQSQKWILDYYIDSERNAPKKDFLVMDRCTLDTLPYVTFLKNHGSMSETDYSELVSRVWLFWDAIDYVKPILFYCPPLPLTENGTRSTNPEFQKSIDIIYRRILDERHIEYNELEVENEEWKIGFTASQGK